MLSRVTLLSARAAGMSLRSQRTRVATVRGMTCVGRHRAGVFAGRNTATPECCVRVPAGTAAAPRPPLWCLCVRVACMRHAVLRLQRALDSVCAVIASKSWPWCRAAVTRLAQQLLSAAGRPEVTSLGGSPRDGVGASAVAPSAVARQCMRRPLTRRRASLGAARAGG